VYIYGSTSNVICVTSLTVKRGITASQQNSDKPNLLLKFNFIWLSPNSITPTLRQSLGQVRDKVGHAATFLSNDVSVGQWIALLAAAISSVHSFISQL